MDYDIHVRGPNTSSALLAGHALAESPVPELLCVRPESYLDTLVAYTTSLIKLEDEALLFFSHTLDPQQDHYDETPDCNGH